MLYDPATVTTRAYFITGASGFIGKRLVAHLARVDSGARITVLVQPKFVAEATETFRHLPSAVEVLSGDIVDMHLGLAGAEYRAVVERTTHIFHLAAISFLGMPHETARKVNVEGTRNVLELGRDCASLERLVHFSTCYVSGDRVGVIAEDELDLGQKFRNAYEATKFEAEKLVQKAKADLPITVVRPSTVVGDSKTGEIDRFEGPYYLGMLLVLSPLVLPLPLPGNGVAPLNVVPVDYVVAAAVSLARNPAAQGRTVHLVDPNPMSARRVYELIAQRANKKLPRLNVPARAADVMLRLPGLEKLTRPQRAAINYVNHLALFNCHTALELLDGTGVRCPPLQSYLDTLVTFALDTWKHRQHAVADETEDPLDRPPR
ncbi:MAG: SDR family oxidoreductase [Archangium sp.]|nr:SDR family oxidoreductase [Archangium sp.]